MESFQISKRLGLCLGRLTAMLPLIFISALMLSACATSGKSNASETSTANAPTAATETSKTNKTETVTTATTNANMQPASDGAQPNAESSPPSGPPAPTLAEAQAAVARVYKNAVTVDTGVRGGKPFLVGDFNNDGVEDIAVVVRPAKGMLAEINNEYANWIIEDVAKVELPVERNGIRVLPPKPAPVKIGLTDQLLVIVHGYQKEAWRNSQARQTYLLKNAVGENMRAMPIKFALAGASAKNPHLSVNGDVIKETIAKQEGFVYWTGAKYAWQH